MGLKDKISKPVEKLKEVQNEIQARNQKKLFFEEQFQVMVENGSIEKAVELIYDEAKNLDARLEAGMTPEELACYSKERCQEILEESEKVEKFESAIKELKDSYNLDSESPENPE